MRDASAAGGGAPNALGALDVLGGRRESVGIQPVVAYVHLDLDGDIEW